MAGSSAFPFLGEGWVDFKLERRSYEIGFSDVFVEGGSG